MFAFEDIQQQVGQRIRVEGFVGFIRVQSKITFFELKSGSQRVQCLAFGAVREQAAELITQGYAAIEGQVVQAEQAPGGFEIHAHSIELISPSIQFPISPESDIGLRLEHPVARFRDRTEALVLAAQSEIEFRMISFLKERGFIGMHTPKLMGSPSESGAEVFEVGYFGKKAFLAQSPQFYKQMAILAGLGKIYESAPVFRAEPSFSSRHATEFISFDVELEGIKSEEELIALESGMIVSALSATIAAMGPELAAAYPLARTPAAATIMTFRDAQALLGISGDASLSAEEERRLGTLMMEKGAELVAITQVPWKQRPFYHMKSGADLTKSFELIYRGVEITTGAVREHRHDVLLAQMAEKGLSGAGAEFYLDSFKYGAPPHGGFGLGLARLTALFLGLPGIKEASFIHRGPERLSP